MRNSRSYFLLAQKPAFMKLPQICYFKPVYKVVVLYYQILKSIQLMRRNLNMYFFERNR